MPQANNKSGVSEQVLSLPKGGGAIKGLGETFQPDLHTGTGNFSIPLSLPPGREGFGPQLTLGYSTGGGNGPFGLGWSLGIPNISRKTSKGIPIYDDEKDTFVLSGAEDLVPVKEESRGDYVVTTYQPRIEGLFARIQHLVHRVDGHDNYWKVMTKDGVVNLYGKQAEKNVQSRIEVKENERLKIFAWYLESSEDPKGNKIQYAYKKDKSPQEGEGIQAPHSYNQVYLDRIEYGNYWPSPRSRKEKYLLRIEFDYEYEAFDKNEHPIKPWKLRPDPFSTYRAGFEIRTARRCNRILIKSLHKDVNPPSHLIRSYDLLYENTQDISGVSILAQVVHRGYTADQPETEARNWDFGDERNPPHAVQPKKNPRNGLYAASLPPITLEYTTFDPRQRELETVTFECDQPPGQSLGDPNHELIGLFGNGLPDILHTTPTGYRRWRNLGRGKFSAPQALKQAPAGITLADDSVQFADLEGNGSADLLLTEGTTVGFYANEFAGEWGTFHPYQQAPSFSLKDPNVRLVDMDGDGVTDVLATFPHHFLYIKHRTENGRLTFEPPVPIPRQHDLTLWPDVYFSHPENRVRLADMSGDGLQDLVLIHDGRADYWPNLGYGKWGKRITLKNGPRLPGRYDPRRVFLADINGDGLADLVYIDSGQVHYWINQSGNQWSNEQIIHGAPVVTDADSVRLADMNGTGTGGILWSYDWATWQQRNYLYLDFTGGTKPLLLKSINNNMGVLTQVQYRPSTQDYLIDQTAGTPWITNLPFPVNVVGKVVVEDQIAKTSLTTRYTYHHGYYDGREREFRGFGRVDQYDAEEFTGQNFALPPTRSCTWFHTGAYFEEKDHLDHFKQEYYQEDDKAVRARSEVEKSDAPHEAYRALSGAILRQEVYALDGTTRQQHPYTVTENGYAVRLIQAKGNNNHAVFTRNSLETCEYHYERNPDDPRINHTMTLEVDPYGIVTKSAAIAYGRRSPDGTIPVNYQGDQTRTLMTYTENRVTHVDHQPDWYRLGVPIETKTFEVTGRLLADLPLSHPAKVKQAIQQADEITYEKPPTRTTNQKRLVEHTRTLYWKNDLSGPKPLGEIDFLVLPFQSYTLVFTPGFLKGVFEPTRLNEVLNLLKDQPKSGYVQGADAITPGWFPEDYPQNARKVWWIPSGTSFFSKPPENLLSPVDLNAPFVQDPAYAKHHYHLPQGTIDPFGNVSQIEYEAPYDLLPKRSQDPVGNVVEVENDYLVFQPTTITDPNDNQTAVVTNAFGLVLATAVMGKLQAATPEGDTLTNFTKYVPGDPFSPNNPHDFLQSATSRYMMDLFRFVEKKGPNGIRTLTRETHVADLPLIQNKPTKIQQTFTYSDGFGREIQSKVQAEPGPLVPNDEDAPEIDPRWVGSGWTIYNNKGNPVRQHEPFFTDTYRFEFERKAGVSPTLFYDPLDRVVATLHPNHTYEKIVFNPWHQIAYDVNDTVAPNNQETGDPRTDQDIRGYVHAFFQTQPADWQTWYQQRFNGNLGPEQKDAAQKAAMHANTPTRTYLDTLGRPFLTRNDNGPEGKYDTHTQMDMEGNPLIITDARGNKILKHILGSGSGGAASGTIPSFDVGGRSLYQHSADAGEEWNLPNVTGNPMRIWDGPENEPDAYEIETSYDSLQRPLEFRYKPSHSTAWIIAEKTVYGETQTRAKEKNLRGQVYQQWDGAGRTSNKVFDFKGNPLQVTRELVKDFDKKINWAQQPEPELDEPYQSETRYDALNRPIQVISPYTLKSTETSKILPNIVQPTYNEANLLESVSVWVREDSPPTTLLPPHTAHQHPITNIDYDAKGQRTKVTHGNQVATVYVYEETTFRLLQQTTIRNLDDPNAKTLQNLEYTYDPVGNITKMVDQVRKDEKVPAQGTYTYDALYRLRKAEGREHGGQQAQNQPHHLPKLKPHFDWNDITRRHLAHAHDVNGMRTYTEIYEYDAVGNILSLNHQVKPTSQSWTRRYRYDGNSNRLVSTEMPGEKNIPTTQLQPRYQHDRNGNLIQMPHLPTMNWDFKDQLQSVDLQSVNEDQLLGVKAYYTYDAGGQRVRKVITDQNGKRAKERIYLGDFEIYREYQNDDRQFERETLHIMDDHKCVALIETKTHEKGGGIRDPDNRTRYQLDNHLGSSMLELDEVGIEISYEEYHPYGTTSYHAWEKNAKVKSKRYRYTGKERDEQTGFYYHGARYYVPWLGRWISPDPLRAKGGLNFYLFVSNNPMVRKDPSGLKDNGTTSNSVKPPPVDNKAGESIPELVHPPDSSPQQRKLEKIKDWKKKVAFNKMLSEYVERMNNSEKLEKGARRASAKLIEFREKKVHSTIPKGRTSVESTGLKRNAGTPIQDPTKTQHAGVADALERVNATLKFFNEWRRRDGLENRSKIQQNRLWIKQVEEAIKSWIAPGEKFEGVLILGVPKGMRNNWNYAGRFLGIVDRETAKELILGQRSKIKWVQFGQTIIDTSALEFRLHGSTVMRMPGEEINESLIKGLQGGQYYFPMNFGDTRLAPPAESVVNYPTINQRR